MSGTLEHVNFTVTDPEATAKVLCDLFDWRIRWQGPSKMGGRTVHVGAEDNYLALYTPTKMHGSEHPQGILKGGMSHIGIVVDDLDAAEKRILAAGFETTSHDDYDPGRRFYFLDGDGIEFEVVSYNKPPIISLL